ncbi:MAG: hypothetical protein ABJL57_11795 [Hyphomonas sp.]|uniref:hypothetical protein n=1 Tax=Hyphomonas sp. TaxID=87 RepID=UPI003265F862
MQSIKTLLAKALGSDEKVDVLATLVAQEQDSPLSMNQIIDRMAAAIYREHRGHKWETLSGKADKGDTQAMATQAKYRRMARKAHMAYHAALGAAETRP